MANPLVIWHFADSKPGHENQVKGLIQAIANRTDVVSYKIQIPNSRIRFLIDVISGKFFRALSKLAKPTYLVAAGNRTHIAMLIAAHYFSGQSILLMRSNWPLSWFDLAIIPEHDQPPHNNRTLATQGVMNMIQPSKEHLPSRGLILIGGPSKHFVWDSVKIVEQITNIVKTHSEVKWTIANSRRTPTDFIDTLHTLSDAVNFVDYTTTSADWLPEQLTQSAYVWVSPDSVSMLYEAVTSGSAVGCLELHKKCNNRIVTGIEKLLSQGMVTSYQQWQTTHSLHLPSSQLNEAQRAADWILSQ